VQKEKRNSVAGRGATRKRMEKVFVHRSLLDNPKIKQIMGETEYVCAPGKEKRGKTRKSGR